MTNNIHTAEALLLPFGLHVRFLPFNLDFMSFLFFLKLSSFRSSSRSCSNMLSYMCALFRRCHGIRRPHARWVWLVTCDIGLPVVLPMMARKKGGGPVLGA